MKPTYIGYTNTYVYNFQTCGFPRHGGEASRFTGQVPARGGTGSPDLSGGYTTFKIKIIYGLSLIHI